MFQGRFKSVHIQQDTDVAEVGRYVHLNPVRIAGLGLEKAAQRLIRRIATGLANQRRFVALVHLPHQTEARSSPASTRQFTRSTRRSDRCGALTFY